jgi:hypothetical protein
MAIVQISNFNLSFWRKCSMTSQTSSFFISLLLISIVHFLRHSFQSNVLLSNNIFCFIEFPNKPRFWNVAFIFVGMPFFLILNNPLAMIHLIFQNNCALVTTPLEMTKWGLTNTFGNSCFGDLLHFVCHYGCVLVLLVQVMIIPPCFLNILKRNENFILFINPTFTHICGVMITHVCDVWYIQISNYWITKCKICMWV